MSTPIRPDDADAPLDPAAERVRRKLVRFMAINLGILFAAVMAVVLAIVYRSVSAPEPEAPAVAATEIPSPPPGSMIAGEIPLPAGARLMGHSLSGGRLTLDIDEAGRRAILVYDIAQGRVVGRFDLVPGR